MFDSDRSVICELSGVSGHCGRVFLVTAEFRCLLNTQIRNANSDKRQTMKENPVSVYCCDHLLCVKKREEARSRRGRRLALQIYA